MNEAMHEEPNMNSRYSALQQAGVEITEFESDTICLQEVPGMSLVRIHCFADSLPQETAAVSLPAETGQCHDGQPSVLCLRPGEFLLLSETELPAGLLRQARCLIDLSTGHADNLTDGLAVFRLSGAGAPWLLSKLSGLDYLAGQSAGTHCAQTRIGHVRAIVFYHRPPDRDGMVFDLVCDRSIAKYLWDLLTESAAHADELSNIHGDGL